MLSLKDLSIVLHTHTCTYIHTQMCGLGGCMKCIWVGLSQNLEGRGGVIPHQGPRLQGMLRYPRCSQMPPFLKGRDCILVLSLSCLSLEQPGGWTGAAEAKRRWNLWPVRDITFFPQVCHERPWDLAHQGDLLRCSPGPDPGSITREAPGGTSYTPGDVIRTGCSARQCVSFLLLL